MLRQIISAAVLGTTLWFAPATPATPPEGHGTSWDHHHARFAVNVWRHGHWHLHGTYHHRDDAEREARHLRHCGHYADVQRI